MRGARSPVGLLLLCHGAATGQAPPARPRLASNAAYLELLGNGGAFSLNYERKLPNRARLRVGAARWTASDLWISSAKTSITALPLLAHWLAGRGNHHLELGAGVLAGHRKDTFGDGSVAHSGGFASLTGTIGYRHQRPLEPGGRFGHVFRAGLVPFFGFGGDESAYPERGASLSIGVSYGLAF